MTTDAEITIGSRVRVVSGRLYQGCEGIIIGRWSMGSQPFEMQVTRFVFRGEERPASPTPLTVFPSELELLR